MKTRSHRISSRTTTTNLSLLLLFTAAGSTGWGQATIQFAVASCTVPELDGSVSLSVRRSNDSTQAVTVDYATADGTATAGVHYLATNGTVAFAPGETNTFIRVPILNDGVVGKTTRLEVSLSNPTGGAVLGSRTVVNVSIQESDKALHFYLPDMSVLEDAGVVEISVARGDDGASPVRVDYATTDATARAGQDYTSTSGTLVFEPGEVVKSIHVPISNDAVLEPAKIFRVALSNPIDGVIGSPAEATVTIQDTDQTFQFESTICRAREESEYVQISIVQGENEASATVDVTTTNGTAIAESDYLGLTNTVHFAPGERLKRIQIPILNDELKEAARSFLVTLS